MAFHGLEKGDALTAMRTLADAALAHPLIRMPNHKLHDYSCRGEHWSRTFEPRIA